MSHLPPNLLILRSSHGGSGKTALSSHLALGLARSGRQVALLELGHQRMALQYLHGLPVPALRHEANGRANGSSARPLATNLWYAAGRTFDARQAAELCQQSFRNPNAPAWLLVDAQGGVELGGDSKFGTVLELQVLRADPASVVSTLELDPPQAHVQFILNQIDHRRPLSRDIDRMLGSLVGQRIVARIHYDEALPESLARLSNVFDSAPSSRIAEALTELVDFIVAAEPAATPIVASRTVGTEQ